jgi:hypothetical protein
MLLLPSVKTKNNFWTSEQRLLTADWKKLFPLTSPTRSIYCITGTGPDPCNLLEEKTGKGAADRATF